ncbi:hypothetical protein EVAR_75158_1 [Eumeta japonica]|uniref:Uncharacterized protein n=1 Tax=Eumeta variegata TaxID=151549 RepID=A0A4C1U0K1_EUMVA|nr:hypothetical protein EVAR_75158_1 [Eumeta japonica]
MNETGIDCKVFPHPFRGKDKHASHPKLAATMDSRNPKGVTSRVVGNGTQAFRTGNSHLRGLTVAITLLQPKIAGSGVTRSRLFNVAIMEELLS